MMIISGSVTVRPISAPDPSRAPPHGAGATGTAKTAAKPASAAGTGPGQGQGQGKGKGKETKEKGPGQDGAKGQQEKKEGQDKGKGKEKEGQQNKDKGKKDAMAGSPEFRQWMRNAVMMLARVVGAYWQVVSPVFDGESELRKRLDKAQATRGDGVMCVLAVVFLFLVVSVGVWAVRGIMWLVRLLGEFGEVLRVVAGLQN
jgi:cobalamin biosynthesis Mg chelatase CobN